VTSYDTPLLGEDGGLRVMSDVYGHFKCSANTMNAVAAAARGVRCRNDPGARSSRNFLVCGPVLQRCWFATTSWNLFVFPVFSHVILCESSRRSRNDS
jgi:hypothetical protein